jgi:hypothetical protein
VLNATQDNESFTGAVSPVRDYLASLNAAYGALNNLPRPPTKLQ